jgi:hypothetical protein
MNGRSLRTRATIAGTVAAAGAGAVTIGLISAVTNNAGAQSTTNSTPTSTTSGSTSTSDTSTGSTDTSGSTGSSGLGNVDQNAPAQAGSNGS